MANETKRPGLYFDKNGDALSREEFARLFSDMKYRRVANDELPDGRRVSTVWLGINYGTGDDGKPLVFETMAFPADSYAETDCRRTTSEEAARAAHAEVLAGLTGKAAS